MRKQKRKGKAEKKWRKFWQNLRRKRPKFFRIDIRIILFELASLFNALNSLTLKADEISK
jgi:hypothetical protein